MSRNCTLTINGQSIAAPAGTTLVDAGLSARIRIPHDCCTGQCETCRVKILSGRIDAEGSQDGDTVLACQALLRGDAAIEYEVVPEPQSLSGIVAAITPLSGAIVEVVVALRRPLDYRAGQYVGLTFAGYPSRDYSPTPRLDGTVNPQELVFHIKRLRQGRVSKELGEGIEPGHKVRIKGPFGRAFLRPSDDILVLVAGGTGWAPIWAIAREARLTQPGRDMIVIAGSRSREGLYMDKALNWLEDTGVNEIIVTSERDASYPVSPGRPIHYLPMLGPQDQVYAAGSPAMVETVSIKARAAGAICYADPFLPTIDRPSFFERLTQWVKPARPLRTAFRLGAAG